MTDYNVVSEREAHFYQGLVAGMAGGRSDRVLDYLRGSVMATFKVGQRVRIKVPGPGVQPDHGFTPPAGKEGIVLSGSQMGGYYLVAVFTVPPPKTGKPGWLVLGCDLEPLTGPAVDAWAAQKVKKLLQYQPSLGEILHAKLGVL